MPVLIDYSTRKRRAVSTPARPTLSIDGRPRTQLTAHLSCDGAEICKCWIRTQHVPFVTFNVPAFEDKDWMGRDELAGVLCRIVSYLPLDGGPMTVSVRDVTRPQPNPIMWELTVKVGCHRASVQVGASPLAPLARLYDAGETHIHVVLPMPDVLRFSMRPNNETIDVRYAGCLSAVRKETGDEPGEGPDARDTGLPRPTAPRRNSTRPTKVKGEGA